MDRDDTDTCTRSAYNMLDSNMPIIHAVNNLNEMISGHIFWVTQPLIIIASLFLYKTVRNDKVNTSFFQTFYHAQLKS